ncbi:aminotransferase class I/II-fold pyridoxal phosphate-dependent enzyme [Aquabacterium soli]|uniref:Aminotransferase class I/II-fold pyridoxal phosphate-dependent enzyme n=1 Tax=Aquabacterium soli TaxID=2493092 RepID=A0A426VEA5_9BURK|nr:aminotransferase class I/II-fold pyridoxal phosphate-dependent enzyme [Aquabacterium soli]RRS05212.1 aminotransferase class I/II-fold pyridoxal phosphate-dependent enzyme [Aquabacterium soli]
MSALHIVGSNSVEIAEQFVAAIRSGAMVAGEALPTVRQLAQQLGVNPNTVASAYARLRDAGLVISDGRRGTRVAEPPSRIETGAQVPDGLIDLAQGNVDAALLPCPQSDWLSTHTRPMTGYDADSDEPELLQMGRQWMDSQGVLSPCLGVFSGALDAIERALRVHVSPGSRAWVEDPCWPPMLALLAHLRLKAMPLLVDSQGCVLPPEEDKASAVILTPRAHNPTGVSMSPQRAAAWSAFLAGRPDCMLVLDDHWGPMARPDGGASLPHAALQVYVLSLSKFLGPDLRIALAAGGPQPLKGMQEQQTLGPRWVSLLLQRLAVSLWRQAQAGGLIERAGRDYAHRRDELAMALKARGLSGLPAHDGLHLWIPVADEAAVVQGLAAKGWAVQPGRAFRLRSAPAIRISVGNLRRGQAEALADDLVMSMRGIGRISV